MTKKRQPTNTSVPEAVSPQFVVRSKTNVEHLLDALNREQSGFWLEEDSLEPKVLEDPTPRSDSDFPERLAALVAGLKALLTKMTAMAPNTAAYVNAVMLPLAELQREFDDIRRQPKISLGDDGRSLVVNDVLSVDESDMKQIFEWPALLGILDLTHAGELGLLRRCFCGRWFKANRVDKEFHLPKCRQLKHSQNPDFKEKRRKRDGYKKRQAARKKNHA